MTRGIALLFLVLSATSAWAQGPGASGSWEPADRAGQRQIEREQRRERREIQREGVHLRFLRSYTLAEGETAREPVVVIGGSARIDGHVEDDVVVLGGSLRLGPNAVVDGDVVTFGGALTRDAGARIGGTIDEARFPWPGIVFDPPWNFDGFWQAAAIWGSVLRLAIVLIVSVLLTLLAPHWIAGMADRAVPSSGLMGLVIEILFTPALIVLTVMLVVSIVGIPLLAAIPFLMLAFGFLWIGGFTGVTARLGRALRGSSSAQVSVGDVLLGYAAIVAVTVVGHVLALSVGWVSPISWPVRSAGLVIEYVAWTIGLGAAVTSLFVAPRIMPPPMPTQSSLSGL